MSNKSSFNNSLSDSNTKNTRPCKRMRCKGIVETDNSLCKECDEKYENCSGFNYPGDGTHQSCSNWVKKKGSDKCIYCYENQFVY